MNKSIAYPLPIPGSKKACIRVFIKRDEPLSAAQLHLEFPELEKIAKV
ncbi:MULTISPECIES: hypothetical protein [Bacillus]|nr:hypothetical protein [Bacillus mobilis]